MIKISGKYNTITVYTNELEESAKVQIERMCNIDIFKDSKIVIMPDVHAGAGCTIGMTMTLIDKVVPNMVGVDIGCGMEVVRIQEKEVDFDKLDKIIRTEIPCGRQVRLTEHPSARDINLKELRCYKGIKKIEEEYKAIGTLGGGNHFIEVDKDDQGNIYLVIHSGSRHLGKMVAEYYQDKAYKQSNQVSGYQIKELIDKMKNDGKNNEIEKVLKEIRNPNNFKVSKDIAYCKDELFDDYIHDMKIMQRFADMNRKVMMDIIISQMSLTVSEQFTTIHNYIDTDNMILRKGAISARKDEKLLIPINMRDGSLICIGKENSDWNNSAPHGAGRICGRKEAKRRFSLREFKESMQGIYSSTINESTLDECPMAYKTMDDIVDNIYPTADIVSIIKPIFNFKAEE